MKVQLIYAEPESQEVITLEVAPPCSVRQAIELSGILRKFPQINLAVNKVGIYGRVVALDTLLNEADRIEIYRPLMIDPKEARLLRASRNPKNS